MKRVAAKQDVIVKDRAQFVYEQKLRIDSLRSNGRLVRSECSETTVIPEGKVSRRQLNRLTGRYWSNGRYHNFDRKEETSGSEADAELVRSFRRSLTKSDTRDGMEEYLFPLTSRHQAEYTFELLGEAVVNGRPVYRIGFRPADTGEYGWAGEALIDCQEFQPVSVFTKLSRKLPLAVRTVLGVDVPGVGFQVQYVRFGANVWFPVSMGTEFRVRVLHFYRRTVTVSLVNSGFRRADVSSGIEYHAN